MKESEAEFRRAIEIGEKIVAEMPNLHDYQELLAQTHGNLGVVLENLDDFKGGKRNTAAPTRSLKSRSLSIPKMRSLSNHGIDT